VRRTLAAVLLLVAAMVPAAAAEDFPVPQEPNQIFYVQRSLNPNTIVYTARINEKGELDPKRPVDVFWRRYNDDGERKDLTAVESRLAFGIGVDPVPGKPGSFMVRVVSYPRRAALLHMVDGVPRLETKVAGRPSRLDHAFLAVDESGGVPHVLRVDLYGYPLDGGELVKESFIP
jgi:hypothetical protein